MNSPQRIDASNAHLFQNGSIGQFHIRAMRLGKGETHDGHDHVTDHISNIIKGPVRIDWYKIYTGERGSVIIEEPCKVLIKAETWHQFTALGDEAVWECWFADPGNADGPFHAERS